MKKIFNKRGFTLIELLVVIAIIGILSSIVLVSLSGAKDRAADARIISNMGQFRTEAEIINDSSGSYASTTCTIAATGCTACGDSDIDTLCDDIVDQEGRTTPTFTIQATATAYCAYVQLKGQDDQYYCVDHNLKAVKTTTNPATAHCNATTWSCP